MSHLRHDFPPKKNPGLLYQSSTRTKDKPVRHRQPGDAAAGGRLHIAVDAYVHRWKMAAVHTAANSPDAQKPLRGIRLNAYQKTALLTVAATMFLIFVGGLVRASGAGLGCPDWPKCYGRWIPPLTVADLPPGYDPAEFNALKTWTEYINRLIGVLVGLFITATFLQSFRYWKTLPSVVLASFAAFVLVIFQGWLGGQVVRSGLSEGIITAHMILAMIILVTLLYAAYKVMATRFQLVLSPGVRRTLLWIGGLVLAATLVQLVLGTQVREAVDAISRGTDLPRAEWLAAVGRIDEIHRSTSWLVILGAAWLSWAVWKHTQSQLLRRLTAVIAALVLCQVAFGVVLTYFAMPPGCQVLHLGFSSFLVCSQFIFLLVVRDCTLS
jgi:heme a synthase